MHFFFFFITSNYKDGQTRGWTKPRHVGRKYHLRNLAANSQNRSLHKKTFPSQFVLGSLEILKFRRFRTDFFEQPLREKI